MARHSSRVFHIKPINPFTGTSTQASKKGARYEVQGTGQWVKLAQPKNEGGGKRYKVKGSGSMANGKRAKPVVEPVETNGMRYKVQGTRQRVKLAQPKDEGGGAFSSINQPISTPTHQHTNTPAHQHISTPAH
jgi:hypothetical protein